MFGAFAGAQHAKSGHIFDHKDLFIESMLFMGAGTSKLEVLPAATRSNQADPQYQQHTNPWPSA